MDVGLRPYVSLWFRARSLVSILVLVDVGLRHVMPLYLSLDGKVSILVLVDVGLRLELMTRKAGMQRFQSLF